MQDTKTGRKVKGLKAGRIIRIEQGELTKHLDEVVRGTVKEALNSLLDAEADPNAVTLPSKKELLDLA